MIRVPRYNNADRMRLEELQGRVKAVFDLGADRPDILDRLIRDPDSKVKAGEGFVELASLARGIEREHCGILAVIKERIKDPASSSDNYYVASRLTAAEILGLEGSVRSLASTYGSRNRHPSSGAGRYVGMRDNEGLE